MCQDRGLSVHPPEKQKSAFPVTVQSVLRQAGPCTAPSALSVYPFLPPGFFLSVYMTSTTSLQITWLPLPSYTRPHGGIPFSFSVPSFRCLAQNFLCDLISGPSYDVLLLPVPPYLLPSFDCCLQSGPEFPMTHELCHKSLYALRVTYTFAAQLLTCHCKAKYFKHCIIHVPFPQLRFVGNMLCYFQGPSLCTPLQLEFWKAHTVQQVGKKGR